MFSFGVLSLSLLSLTAVVRSSIHKPSERKVFADAWAAPGLQPKPQVVLDAYDTGLFMPVGHMSAISSADFTILEHPLFPHHSVRVKKSYFCDGTVPAYTGYIDNEARHLFFYFFESRDDPDKDDVIFWTNGGPGGSSAIGLFMELGPCTVTSTGNTTFNPYSWNAHANIFFIDQPVGVGFSYAEYGESVGDSIEAGRDIAVFSAIFFEHFTKFKGRGYHLAGESYAGRYLPVFATEILKLNPWLLEAGLTPINLESIMIGNGCTHMPSMVSSKYDMQCKNISVPPIQDISTCVRLKQIRDRCKTLMRSCDEEFNVISCKAVFQFCDNSLEDAYLATGYNPYDISKYCEGPYEETLCYPITSNISTFLNRADTREALGVDPAVENYILSNMDVWAAFWGHLEIMFPTQYYIGALLERGIRVLVYVGANDWICNWVGNERMTLDLEWTRQAEFVSQPLREWEVDGAPAGLTRNVGPFTFATIFGAGHMAPYDKPKESLELLKRWIVEQDP
ncbi:serine carboxypeptidase [Obba rivulosa]|uniref:Carboxypeptidase n=1 Tax=Obba rivulosa TaxID=1052685 RepID=A0A8E2AXQ0_9APHY|nr:serine carboxypeptidase [Obba rivulosa]